MARGPTRNAPAKVNLTLHVTGRRDDGYHTLSSLVVFADVCDRLTLLPDGGGHLRISGPFSHGVPVDHSNLVARAAALLGHPLGREDQSEDKRFDIALEKHLPHGAGIGGGSSDAAAALRLIADHFGLPLPEADRVLGLGADVPVCLAGPAPQVMAGIGEVIRPASAIPRCWLVLANPGVLLPTARVFQAMNGAFSEPMPDMPTFRDVGDLAAWLSLQRNDMQAAAEKLAPEIGVLRQSMGQVAGCRLARMSGSGSTVFGLFENEASAARATELLARPGRWVKAAQVL